MILKDERYWHEKHPTVKQRYYGRPLPGTNDRYPIDVRRFIWSDDLFLQDIVEKQNLRRELLDDTAYAAQRYVCDLLTYVSDSRFGVPEYWLFPVETALLQKGDCLDYLDIWFSFNDRFAYSHEFMEIHGRVKDIDKTYGTPPQT